ncbi:MAG: hypothetical protein ABJH98_17715 [Reichenbachiella sp.]|uniref:hypothetical protein n=1 Tax=Reichenbachiella sp. TaxID=2184521 RepID=UPI0032660309
MRYTLVVGVFLLCFGNASAQYNVKSESIMDVSISVYGSGLGASLGYGYIINREAKLAVYVGSAYGKIHAATYNPIFLEGKMMYKVNGDTRTSVALFNVVGGVVIQYDRIISGLELADSEAKSSVNFGFGLGAEIEIKMTNRAYLYGSGMQKYFIKEDFGRWRYQISAGLRFVI